MQRVPAAATARYVDWSQALSDQGLWLESFREATVLQPTWSMPVELLRMAGGWVHETTKVYIAQSEASCDAACPA